MGSGILYTDARQEAIVTHHIDQVRDRDQLIACLAGGLAAKYLFFWGHTPPRDGSVGKACFSQWWHTGFHLDGVHYRTAEHWMMAQKAVLFGDEHHLQRILEAGHPRDAKMLGRKVAGFDQHTWEAACFDIVVRGNVAKFTQNAAEGAFLLGTGHRVLVEASPQDRIWGIGLSERDEAAGHPETWRGQNLLGFALMEVRARLRSGVK